jgi:trk system potassium uptake protein TrkA
MKYIIIGLGNFGSALAIKLTQAGHEVIGVDKNISRVDFVKESVTYAVCLDSSDPEAVKSLPLKNADVVVISIGENEGANIMATALMKKMNVKRIIARSLNSIHENVLEAMGVTEMIRPEEETADRWVTKLSHEGVLNTFELAKGYEVTEVEVPMKFVGQSLEEIGFIKNYSILILTIIKKTFNRNFLGATNTVYLPQGIPQPSSVLETGDILALYGKKEDIRKLLED